MESRKIEPVSRPSSAKQPYEPPRASFVPLKLEERLLSCAKASPDPQSVCRNRPYAS